ncbi:hypothetical protein W822_05855 [Advenella kashmirensis W13003]|uniref:Uncharacterized protein n=1 Tax=Advenella kashmirensis W13003 TaxID=1424334 RepID=V8QVE6_9BURK|nr:hypothetical protein [Advenella kashmirensis]ETF03602.1 hypothetical protein W822_05855 [Advenella kashmirensis W13003]
MNRALKAGLIILGFASIICLFTLVDIDFSSKTSLLIAAGTFTAAIISLYIANSNWKRETDKERSTEEKKRILFLSLCDVTMNHYKEAVWSFNNVKNYSQELKESFVGDHVENTDRQLRLCELIYRELEFNKIKFDYVNFNLIIRNLDSLLYLNKEATPVLVNLITFVEIIYQQIALVLSTSQNKEAQEMCRQCDYLMKILDEVEQEIMKFKQINK